MFFRRMFGRKDDIGELDDGDESNIMGDTDENDNSRHWSDFELYRSRRRSKQNSFRKVSDLMGIRGESAGISQRNIATLGSSSSSTSLQLTPLWEHILRTRTLPENICPIKMFSEFNDRLRDPEWQVRQHALRVFVDVLVVMNARADAFMEPVIPQLVENLGHPAPTIRKGALDCLRVYLSETAMPETIMLQVLDIGLNQKITNEPFGGRLTCGVMLSLPALVQSTLHTTKRHFILRAAIDMLVQKMGQVTHQEITLKVLSKIRDLIGENEFSELMSHGAYREFELLCNVYEVGASNDASAKFRGTKENITWRCMADKAPISCWRSSDEEQMLECASHGKVIMETEIKINDDTVTMRILEAKDDEITETENSPRKQQTNDYPNSLEDEVVCGRLASARSEREITGIIHVLSDSEVEENNKGKSCSNQQREELFTLVTPSTPSRTPKRVTFGGEVVKMRTPDSDATTSNSNANGNNNVKMFEEPGFVTQISPPTTDPESTTSPVQISKTTELSVEIPNDYTKPIMHPRTPQSPKKTQNNASPALSVASTMTENTPTSPQSPAKRRDSTTSLSPRSPFKRISISPVDSIISPKVSHKEIEVLHNLQRDPSPVRIRSAKSATQSTQAEVLGSTNKVTTLDAKNFERIARETPPPPKSWEELDIVDYDTLMDLRSGNWRFRLQGVTQLEDALRSSDNLALIQPCLATLLRTLLSSERNNEVAEAKHRALTNLISRLPLDNLEERAVQIMTGLCRQGGAGANRVCKALMQRLLPAVIVLKLISREFLHAKSSRFRENALQMVMYALMTFPSTCFDTKTCITNAIFAAINRKRRVRQSALEVLAILGQVTTTREVMEVVQNAVEETQREDGTLLVAAVKARLSRKQLPLVTAEGVVQYTLRPSAAHCVDGAGNGQWGPDIEWITTGVGSVSPTSMRRRAYKVRGSSQQNFCTPTTQGGRNCRDGIVGSSTDDNFTPKNNTSISSSNEVYEKEFKGNRYLHGDDSQSYKLQHVLGNSFTLTSRKPNIDHYNYKNRRLVAKSCSDSSMEGRSSDSTYTSSSGGDGNIVSGTDSKEMGCGGGISGRFTRQPINSRFPTMDLNTTCARVHKPPAYYPGMGAYAQLQQQQYNMSSTYPKVNYTLPPHQRRRSHQTQQQQQQQVQYSYNNNYQSYQTYQPQQQQRGNSLAQESFKQIETCNKQQNNANENDDNLDGTYTISERIPDITNDGTFEKRQQQQQKEQQEKQEQKIFTNGGNNNTTRRFVNVEKFRPESNNKSQSNDHINATISTENNKMQSKQATPVSAKSTSYSQKSTASAKSSHIEDEQSQIQSNFTVLTDPNKQYEGASRPASTTSSNYFVQNRLEIEYENELQIVNETEINDLAQKTNNETHLKRSVSILSMQSKSDSINTVMEESPPAISRNPSTKSLVIEEDIDTGTDSFVIVEEAAKQKLNQVNENISISDFSSPEKTKDNEIKNNTETPDSDELVGGSIESHSKPSTATSRTRSPTIAELKVLSRRNSMVKSMESLYERNAAVQVAKEELLDMTTETSSQSSNQAVQPSVVKSIPLNPQHTPLKQKAKTTYFLRNHRRVSPVKQSIKMQQAELFPTTLQRFEKPRDALLKTFDQLDSSNWEIVIQGLKSIVRLMRHHADYLETQMHMVCIQLTRSVRNLRSQVARAACQAATEIFALKSKSLEQECDDLVCALLHRSADTNRFLRADATRALESMCDNLTPSKVLNILTTKGAHHQNALVRTTTAKLLNRLLERLGKDKVYSMHRESRDKFFVTGANLLLEGSLETRSYAKSLFRMLSEHPNFNRLVKEVIPPSTYRNIEKTLKTIR